MNENPTQPTQNEDIEQSEQPEEKHNFDAHQLEENAGQALAKVYSFAARNRVLLVATVSAVVVLLAFWIVGNDIGPERNEQAYQEGLKSINYQSINEEHLKTLEDSLQSSGVEVETDLAPNRVNPFAE